MSALPRVKQPEDGPIVLMLTPDEVRGILDGIRIFQGSLVAALDGKRPDGGGSARLLQLVIEPPEHGKEADGA